MSLIGRPSLIIKVYMKARIFLSRVNDDIVTKGSNLDAEDVSWREPYSSRSSHDLGEDIETESVPYTQVRRGLNFESKVVQITGLGVIGAQASSSDLMSILQSVVSFRTKSELATLNEEISFSSSLCEVCSTPSTMSPKSKRQRD